MPSRAPLLTQLLTGDIDVVNGLDPADAERVAADPRQRVVGFPDRGYSQIRWDLRRPHFADRRVRRALTMAIDRQAIIDVVYLGRARPSVGPVISAMWAFNRSLQPVAFDPAGARRLLAEAGWVDSDGDGTLDRDGVELAFELLTNAENDLRQDICLLVEQNLARVGVAARPRFVEWGTMLALETGGDFDAIVSGWIEPTLIDLGPLWHSAHHHRIGRSGHVQHMQQVQLVGAGQVLQCPHSLVRLIRSIDSKQQLHGPPLLVAIRRAEEQKIDGDGHAKRDRSNQQPVLCARHALLPLEEGMSKSNAVCLMVS